jgi:ribosomal-protein-alanine N-acetyltransferase
VSTVRSNAPRAAELALQTASLEEVRALLGPKALFHDYVIVDGALPPARILERAIEFAESHWALPRMICADRQVVGTIGYKDAPRNGRVEIGYNVSPQCRRFGYATGGVRLIVQEAFASGRVEEVFAEVWVGNPASRRVLEKAGFTLSGAGTCAEGPTEFWSVRKPPP